MIETLYDFPRPPAWKLYPHQVETAEFFVRNRRAFCFNAIGTMKTSSALWAADFLMHHGRVRSVLVVSPLSTLQRVWADEIFKLFKGRRSSAILYGDREKRLERAKRAADFYILNHDGLKVLCDFAGGINAGDPRRALLSEPLRALLDKVDLVIVDEGAVFRNCRTDLWASLRAVLLGPDGRPNRLGTWWMTGAPCPNAPSDLWAQARLVNPTLVPKFFGRFRSLVERKVTQFKWAPRRGWEDIAFPMLRPAVRYTRDSVELPPEVWEPREAALSPEQSRLYAELLREGAADLAAGRLTVANEGVLRTKLLQVCAGAVYTSSGATQELDTRPRLRVLFDFIEAAGGKCIVFTPFKHTQQVLLKALQKARYTVGLVNGDVSAGRRNKIFHEFQDGDLQVLLAHPECMAHGLTLTASHVIVWWAPIDGDLEIFEQACGRIKRAGQAKTQIVGMIESSPLEKEVYRRLRQKEKVQGALLELLRTEVSV